MLLQPPSSFTDIGGHVAISASLPSGLSGVRDARDALSELLLRAGSYPLCEFCYDYVPVIDLMMNGPSRYRPDVISGGEPECAGDMSWFGAGGGAIVLSRAGGSVSRQRPE